MNAFERFLASILNPGGRFSAGGMNRLASAGVQPASGNALQELGMPATPEQVAAAGPFPPAPPMPQGRPQGGMTGQPQPVQMPQSAPQSSPGGGVGDFLANLFTPQRAAKNETISWLASQGLDEGTATLLAGNKQALQSYLLQRTQGADPKDALQLEKLGLEIEQMRNPTTDDVREYQFAREQGYEGNFTDFMKEMRQAGATTVDARQMGNIPPGFQVEYDEQGRPVRMAPIPGSPAAMDVEKAAQAEENRSRGQVQRSDIVTQEIDRILDVMDSGILPDTGVGAWLSGVPGTDAKAVSSLLDTVKANIGFEELNRMRQQSPTGGALGQVTERELAFLQSVAGNLDQGQSADQLKDNLNRLWNTYMEVIHGPGNFEARPLKFQSKSQLPEGVSDEDVEYTMKKHGLTREQVLERLNAH